MNKPSFPNNLDQTWTLFLDRDGTINERNMDGYIQSWDEFQFIPGVLDALAKANIMFQYIIIVTNQQGVGKEIMTRDDLLDIHEKMAEEIAIHGGRIDEIYSCEGLATEWPNCRKPSPEMAILARDAFPDIQFRRSIMIGDTASDIEFGKSCEMKTILVAPTPQYDGPKPDMICFDLKESIERLSLHYEF